MNKTALSRSARVVLLIVAAVFLGVLFVPIWRIELDAPQYPEGLVLQLFANKVAGDVEVINGLNHYIGMKGIHTADFFEFGILPYILCFFALFSIGVALWRKRVGLYALLGSFVAFIVIAGVDFYHWNYDYGHNLNPNAAIKVPGMAYQPPLLGYKELLNFGAFSIPDIGGWMMGGILVALLVLVFGKCVRCKCCCRNTVGMIGILSLFLVACGRGGAVPIVLNKDVCHFCQMQISDGTCGAEFVTKKGRAYVFDDLRCMVHFLKEYSDIEAERLYCHDGSKNNELIAVEGAFFASGGRIKTPMHGNVLGFSSEKEMRLFCEQWGATPISWNDVRASGSRP